MNQATLRVKKYSRLNTIVIQQSEPQAFFVGSQKALVFNISAFLFIIKFLVFNHIIDPETIEGILEEYHSA